MVPVTKVYGIQRLGSGACSVKRNVHCCCARAPQASSPPTEGPRRSPEAKKMATPENPLTKCVGTPKTFCSTRKRPNRLFTCGEKGCAARNFVLRLAAMNSNPEVAPAQQPLYALPVTVLRHCSKAGVLAVISGFRRWPCHHRQHCVGMEKQADFRPKSLTC